MLYPFCTSAIVNVRVALGTRRGATLSGTGAGLGAGDVGNAQAGITNGAACAPMLVAGCCALSVVDPNNGEFESKNATHSGRVYVV